MLLPANPKSGYLSHKNELDRVLRETIESGWYILGPKVKQFEEHFSTYIGARNCIGVASGTDAVHLALRACNVGPGDGVITVSHTAVATVSAVEWLGARPILVDIVEESFTIDPSRVEDTLRKDMKRRIRAIIVVHIYGHPADMSALTEIGRRYDIPVIEDCAQAHGAKIGDLRVGSFGACGAFSFYPTKNLGAFGDGGAIVTNDTNLAERIQLLRQYGWRERYISSEAGYNSRLDELQAALLDCKLNWLDADNERRRLIARRYTEGLAGLPLKTPVELPGTYHVYHQYTIRLSDRNGLRKHLEAQGVGTSVLYPVPVHLQPCYRERVEIGCGGMAFTEKSAGEILCLPIYPELHDAEVNLVISEIQSFFRG